MNRYLLLLLLVSSACGGSDHHDAAAQQPADSPRTVVDSILPVEEEIRRFKAARNHAPVEGLRGGARTRHELVRNFILALERADTAALRAMVLNAAEFIDLYYPVSMFARPPYKQSPELRWFLVQENSNKGLTRLLQRYGGESTGFQGYSCAETPTLDGENRLWDRCRVSWRLSAGPMRAFSSIIEHEGQFKIFSYANDL